MKYSSSRWNPYLVLVESRTANCSAATTPTQPGRGVSGPAPDRRACERVKESRRGRHAESVPAGSKHAAGRFLPHRNCTADRSILRPPPTVDAEPWSSATRPRVGRRGRPGRARATGSRRGAQGCSLCRPRRSDQPSRSASIAALSCSSVSGRSAGILVFVALIPSSSQWRCRRQAFGATSAVASMSGANDQRTSARSARREVRAQRPLARGPARAAARTAAAARSRRPPSLPLVRADSA